MVVEGLLLWWQEADSLTAWQKENEDCFCIIGDELGVEHRQLPPPQSKNPQGTGLEDPFVCTI